MVDVEAWLTSASFGRSLSEIELRQEQVDDVKYAIKVLRESYREQLRELKKDLRDAKRRLKGLKHG